MSGVNTLLQTWFGTRLPTVMGPSFAYIISVKTIINDLADRNFSSEHEVCLFVFTVFSIQSTYVSSFLCLVAYISICSMNFIYDCCYYVHWIIIPYMVK